MPCPAHLLWKHNMQIPWNFTFSLINKTNKKLELKSFCTLNKSNKWGSLTCSRGTQIIYLLQTQQKLEFKSSDILYHSPSSSHHLPWLILAKTDIPKTFYQATWGDTRVLKNLLWPNACDRCTLPNHFSALARCEVVFVVIMWFSVFVVWVHVPSNVRGMGAPLPSLLWGIAPTGSPGIGRAF